MVKINIKTVFPKSQRDVFIHAFRSIGWKYERIIQNGEFSLFRFFGKLPECSNDSTNVDVILTDGIYIDLNQFLVSDVEIFVQFERS